MCQHVQNVKKFYNIWPKLLSFLSRYELILQNYCIYRISLLLIYSSGDVWQNREMSDKTRARVEDRTPRSTKSVSRPGVATFPVKNRFVCKKASEMIYSKIMNWNICSVSEISKRFKVLFANFEKFYTSTTFSIFWKVLRNSDTISSKLSIRIAEIAEKRFLFKMSCLN